MSWSTLENEKAFLEQEAKKQQSFGTKAQQLPASIVEVVRERKIVIGEFFIVYTAVFMHYLFTGLTMLFHGKLPTGYAPVTKKQVFEVISNLDMLKPEVKEIKKYGRVVDLDNLPPKIDLMKKSN